MERETRRVFLAAALVVAALVVARLWPQIRKPFLPKLEAAWVAVQPEGESAARAGTLELASGRRFRLFAVLAARSFGGRRTYFTEAPALVLDGREVEREALRAWPAKGRIARVRWSTVDGFAPYLGAASEGDLERFRFAANFHAEWGSGWSVDGVADPRNVQLEPESPLRPLSFGTERYQVRIELYEGDEAITPSEKIASPGEDAALAAPATVTTVVASLPAPLGRLSRAFGLTQIDPGAALPRAARERIEAWQGQGLAFERVALVAEHVAAAGRDPATLPWTAVDLAIAPPGWTEAGEPRAPGSALPGDLLQAGDRIVALFSDQGVAGRLDPADLVFDFHRGAKIRRIEEVFREAGSLELEWAQVAP